MVQHARKATSSMLPACQRVVYLGSDIYRSLPAGSTLPLCIEASITRYPMLRLLCRPHSLACAAIVMLSWGCALPRPAAVLPEDKTYVAVLSGQMPPPIDEVARHAWIVSHHAGSKRYPRFEMGGDSETDPFADFAAGDVMLHGVVAMTEAELDKLEPCMRKALSDYHQEHPDYFPIPGPNSNTLVAFVLRKCDIHVELPATAIGRDYVGVVGAQVTESGTGIQVGTLPFGIRLGLQEGIEFQLFGLPLGIHFWPPGITVPVNPGRIGFATDAHVRRPFREKSDAVPAQVPNRGVGTVMLPARMSMPVHPSRAGGAAFIGTVGLEARLVYGGRVGYGVGLDFHLGAAGPAGFAGGVHLYPVGIGYAISSTGFVGIFSGFGTTGVTGAVPAGAEFPQEIRAEFDITDRARIAMRAQGIFIPGLAARRQSATLFDETLLGIYTRFGKRVSQDNFAFASGTVIGLERRELMGTPVLSLVIGTEIDAAMRKDARRATVPQSNQNFDMRD
jgi:hypothetical protein